MREALISVEGLTVALNEKHNRRQILQDISFTLGNNQILGIVGNSGAGKSMTMNAISGMLPDEARVVSGKVIYHGTHDILKMDVHLRQPYCAQQMAIIPQDSINALNPYEKIKKQLKKTFLLHHPLRKKELDVHIQKTLLDVGLEGNAALLDKYPHQLSGGMRQRIAIAMALFSNARILVADEPTTSLDTVNQKQFITFLKELCASRNLSMIYISHNLGLVEYLCDDVLVMNNGRMVEYGAIHEVFSKPQAAYTKDLVAATGRLFDRRGVS